MHGVAVDPIVTNLTVFVLAIFVGYHVVWTVTPALHTPLMSVTNAISSVIIVGAILAAGSTIGGPGAVARRPGGGAGGDQHLRRLPGHRADARDVQEERAEGEARGEGRVSQRTSSPFSISSPASSSSSRSKGLSHPLTARRGNRFGIVGMAIAVVTTLAIAGQIQWALLALTVGGVIGWYVAKRVEMTQMPELVAAMHSLVGLAAVLIAVAVVNNPLAFNIPIRFRAATGSSCSSARSSAR